MHSGTSTKRMGEPTAPRRLRSTHVHPLLYAALVLAVFLGTLQAAQWGGLWVTSGKIDSSGQAIQITGTDPAEVKGWMTINDVLSAYHVPQAEFYARFQIPPDVAPTQALKDLEAVAPDFSVTELRSWLAERAAP